jgi:inner membrane protein
MDNLTHSLVGLTAAKAGLEKLSPGATTLCILAANAPDVDLVVLIARGRWAFLQHHRGITHSLVGAAVLAFALPLIFYFGDRIVARLRTRGPSVKFKGLLLASFLTTATHPLLDWTNNYGMRFLLPWNPRWSYGDFAFVIDPFFWIVLGGSAFLLTATTRTRLITWVAVAAVPSYLVLQGAAQQGGNPHANVLRVLWISALIVLVILYRQKIGERLGAKVALAALITVTIYCAGLAAAHTVALRKANHLAAEMATRRGERVVKLAAMPTVVDPVDWVCVFETDRATYKFSLSLLAGAAPPANVIRYEKLSGAEADALAIASRDSRAAIFLGFARFPVFRVIGASCQTQTLVQLADLRYTEPGKQRAGNFSLEVPIACLATAKDNR